VGDEGGPAVGEKANQGQGELAWLKKPMLEHKGRRKKLLKNLLLGNLM